MTAIVWLRDDLRLDDQPAIRAAAAHPALFIYVHDDAATRPLGGASRWWLDKSLAALAASLESLGARLDIIAGAAEEVIPALARHADAVFWTRRYGAPGIEADSRIKATLKHQGVRAESFNGQLLREPWTVKTEAGAPFKVFTPFWRRCREMGPFEPPTPAPKRLLSAPWPQDAPRRAALADLALHPSKPDWSAGLAKSWRPGEAGARARLQHFLEHGLADYAAGRDRLDGETTSRLSPHLRFGEISPRRIVAAVAAAGEDGRGGDKFLSEIGWREFAYSLLFQAPELAVKNWSLRFDAFPWRQDEAALEAWRRGRTGYPVVDAGMRELWATGYMHNRVRMIAASFLTKHLVLDWRLGEQWFWDTLCDADEANNPASWQWVAGSGADAAPYFRVFNPILQGEKFDPEGRYVRRWVPELAGLDARYIHTPWKAGATRGYPAPIVDHDFARKRALEAFAEIGPQRSPIAPNSAKKSG